MTEEAAIVSLLKRERYYRDTLQTEKLRQCYVPDASRTHICVSVFKGNADEFVAMSERSTPPGMRVLHNIDPVDIAIKGGRALAHSNGIITTRTVIDEVECDITSWVRAISGLERVDGQWKMVSLEVIYNRDSLSTASPQDKTIALDGIGEYRSSYRHVAWFMSRRGLRVSDDLPGEDRPETVERVLQRNQQWFEGSRSFSSFLSLVDQS